MNCPFAREIAEEYLVKLSELLSSSREEEVVEARAELMRRLRTTGLSMARIGQLVGRHHSTVSHHLARRKG